MKPKPKLSEETIVEVINLYQHEGLSLRVLASRFHVSHQSIRKYLANRGVQIRNNRPKRTRNGKPYFRFILLIPAHQKADLDRLWKPKYASRCEFFRHLLRKELALNEHAEFLNVPAA